MVGMQLGNGLRELRAIRGTCALEKARAVLGMVLHVVLACLVGTHILCPRLSSALPGLGIAEAP